MSCWTLSPWGGLEAEVSILLEYTYMSTSLSQPIDPSLISIPYIPMPVAWLHGDYIDGYLNGKGAIYTFPSLAFSVWHLTSIYLPLSQMIKVHPHDLMQQFFPRQLFPLLQADPLMWKTVDQIWVCISSRSTSMNRENSHICSFTSSLVWNYVVHEIL